MHVSLRMAEGVCPYMSPLHDPLSPHPPLRLPLCLSWDPGGSCPPPTPCFGLPRVPDLCGLLPDRGGGCGPNPPLWSQVCPAYVPAYTARAREAWRPAGWKQAQSPDRRFWAWHAHSNIDGPSGWP